MNDDFEKKIESIQKIPSVKAILERLQKELSKDLCYHTYSHTLDVMREAVSLALEDHLSDREIILLGVAAAFHDAGFIVQKDRNEEIGAKIALQALASDKSYSKDELELIKTMILDTEVVRPATHKLSCYLIDADLTNFGRDDFFEKCELIIKENNVTDTKQFYRNLHKMLSEHAWLTDAAKKKRQAKKDENVKKLGQLIL